MSCDLFQSGDTIRRSCFERDFATLWIIGIVPLITRESNHAGDICRGTVVDHLAGRGDDLILIPGIIESFHERSTRHAVWRNGTGEAVFLEDIPRVRAADFN